MPDVPPTRNRDGQRQRLAPDRPPPTSVWAMSDEPVDLDVISRDLAGVEAALKRLDDGSYWTDEVTGEPIDEILLASNPVARQNA
jgi:hypothetical protein